MFGIFEKKEVAEQPVMKKGKFIECQTYLETYYSSLTKTEGE